MLALLLVVVVGQVRAEDRDAQPTYQRARQRHDGGYRYDRHPRRPDHYHQNHYPRRHGQASAHASGGTFQRPYPYHLDYYRMRWGGSYAPYFGNLYGPPNVVLGVPYGYYGGAGYYNGFDGAYGVPYDTPNGAIYEGGGQYGVPNEVVPNEVPPVVAP